MRSAIRQVSSVALLLLAAAWMSQPVSAAFRFVSGVTAVTQTSAGVELELGADGVARVEFHFADTVRVRWNPGGVFSSRRTGSVVGPADVLSSVQVYDGADAVYLLSGAATVIIVKSGMRIILLRPDGSLVNAFAACRLRMGPGQRPGRHAASRAPRRGLFRPWPAGRSGQPPRPQFLSFQRGLGRVRRTLGSAVLRHAVYITR